jgi:hypothetical protein
MRRFGLIAAAMISSAAPPHHEVSPVRLDSTSQWPNATQTGSLGGQPNTYEGVQQFSGFDTSQPVTQSLKLPANCESVASIA